MIHTEVSVTPCWTSDQPSSDEDAFQLVGAEKSKHFVEAEAEVYSTAG
jgi:hypothetical protein